MKKQIGYVSPKVLTSVVWVGLIAIVVAVIAIPTQTILYLNEQKANEELIRQCELNLPREQYCVIEKRAVVKVKS